MGKVRKRVIDNPVYSEIILAMADEPTYVSKLLERIELSPSPRQKTQPVLREQLLYLKKIGYVKNAEEFEISGSLTKNKIYFKVSWEKVVEDFINYVLEYSREQNKKRRDTIIADHKNLLKDIEKYKKNKLIQDVLRSILDIMYGDNFTGTLSEIYNKVVELELMKKSRDAFITELGLFAIYRDRILFYKKLSNEIGNDLTKSFRIFDEFVDKFPSSYTKPLFEQLEEIVCHDLVKKYQGDEKAREYFKKDVAEMEMMQKQKPFLTTIAKEDKSIKIDEVKGLINKMEKIRQEELSDPKRYFKSKDTPKRIYDILVHIKMKYYFIRFTDEYYGAYATLQGLKDTLNKINRHMKNNGLLYPFDLFGAVFCMWMLNISAFYGIRLGEKKKKEIMRCYLKYRHHEIKG